MPIFSVVLYIYDVDVFKENVVMGNDALMKCQIPSLVSDLVSVDSWADSKGNEILKSDSFGNNREFEISSLDYRTITKYHFI